MALGGLCEPWRTYVVLEIGNKQMEFRFPTRKKMGSATEEASRKPRGRLKGWRCEHLEKETTDLTASTGSPRASSGRLTSPRMLTVSKPFGKRKDE